MSIDMSVIPRDPSNRTIYRQLLRWGWEKKINRNNMVLMRYPLSGDEEWINDPHSHSKAPQRMLKKMIEVTCHGDPVVFWKGPNAPKDEMSFGEAMEAIAGRERAEMDPRAVKVKGILCPKCHFPEVHVEHDDVFRCKHCDWVMDGEHTKDNAVIIITYLEQEGKTVPQLYRDILQGKADPTLELVSEPTNGTTTEETEVAQTDNQPGRYSVPRTRSNQGLANKILDAMLARPGSYSTEQIGKMVGVDRTVISSSAAYLVQLGLLARVKTGFYTLSEQMKADDVRIRHQIQQGAPVQTISDLVKKISVEPVAVYDPQRTGLPGDPRNAPAWVEPFQPVMARDADLGQDGVPAHPTPQTGAQAPTAAYPGLDEDTVDAVLDLLLPNGYKARHRRVINQWVEDTMKMIHQVTEG